MEFFLEDVEKLKAGSDWQITIVEGSDAHVHIDHAGSRTAWLYYDGRELQFGEEPRVGLNLNFKGSRATVTVPRLPLSMEASSSSSIEASFKDRGEELLLKASSSGKIRLGEIESGDVKIAGSSSARIEIDELRCESLDLALSSSARFTVGEGSAAELATDLSSSSRFGGRDFLITDFFRIRGSSSSRQEFRVDKDVAGEGSLSSSSLLILHGDPSARANSGY